MVVNVSQTCAATQEYAGTCMNLAKTAIGQSGFWENASQGFWIFLGAVLMLLGFMAIFFIFSWLLNRLRR